MRYHHFQKKVNFQRNIQSHWCSHRKLFWERRKKKTVSVLTITKAPVLCTQEIQLKRRMSERIEVFISVHISIRKVTVRFIISVFVLFSQL